MATMSGHLKARGMEGLDTPDAAKERIRITLDVTPPMKAVLDKLTTQSGTTQSEVLRRAIALLSAVKEAEAKGEGTPAIEKDGRVVVRLVGI
jgi:hypothetical protein